VAGIVLSVERREKVGTGGARATRKADLVPGVLYGGARGAVSIEVGKKELVKALRSGKFVSHLITLKHKDETQPVIPRAIQYHPVTDEPIHIDLFRVEEDTVIDIEVPVKFVNHEASPGLKRGGVLNIVDHMISMRVLAAKIPEQLTIDLTGLEIGAVIHASALTLPEGAVLRERGKDPTVATISGRMAEDAAPASADAAPAADAKAAPAKAPAKGDKK
jgi:large subunit ribosomal protein L25